MSIRRALITGALTAIAVLGSAGTAAADVGDLLGGLTDGGLLGGLTDGGLLGGLGGGVTSGLLTSGLG
ncbi:hypothetical protein J7F01_35260 [Streptomyces sp. ISL-22]|uniref:hypothetical protein n=1 Tax=unclassified Streptomyces TaxID=2593676 RepID=UPI001BE6BBF5|nr:MULTISPECIES: hypothetical protein [unclassified Streptomyces]MBT2421298.1 hypothetical protein [Streptomyces sp. ISL-24]MBT2437322.1 hypothetical protein [Streptomyces sp. ISL-22]